MSQPTTTPPTVITPSGHGNFSSEISSASVTTEYSELDIGSSRANLISKTSSEKQPRNLGQDILDALIVGAVPVVGPLLQYDELTGGKIFGSELIKRPSPEAQKTLEVSGNRHL